MYKEGMALVQEGRLTDAIETFERGLSFDSRNLVLLDAIGATYTLEGDNRRAQQYLEKALQVDPKFVPARKNIAISYFNSNQYDLAVPEFESLIADPRSSAVANLFLGIIAERRAEYGKSALFLEKSGELAYGYPQALLSWAHSLYELRQPPKAEAILTRFDVLSRVSAQEYFQAGLLYSQHGQDKKALADYDRANVTAPELPGLSYQRAITLDRLGRSPEAVEVLKDLTARQPEADSLNLLAHVAEKTGDLRLAIQSLRQAAELAPQKEDNYLDFSTICLDYENYPLALEIANVGLAHIPNSYRLLVQKGAILDKLGRRDKAEEVFREASKLQADNSVALLSLAITQTHARHFQDAIGTLSSAVDRFPGNYYMHYYLGNILVQMGETGELNDEMRQKAERELREGIRLNPSFADSYYQLSKLLLHQNPKLAEENLLTCLRLDPEHASAEYELGHLYLRTGRQKEGQRLIDRFISQQEAEKLKEQQKPRVEATQ